METNRLHSEYCVAFVDILGFKEMTKNYDSIQRNATAINQAISTMKTYRPNNIFEKTTISILQMSDSLVFMFPKEFSNVFTAIRWIMILQFLLAKKGIYIRGSINSGAMYIDTIQDLYFGEAWNKAVILEAEAVTPRILIEPSIAKLVESHMREINEGVLEFYLDDDGNYVLSSYSIITAVMATQFNDAEVQYSEMLNELLINAEKVSRNGRILRKYLWIVLQAERENNSQFAHRIKEIKDKILDYLTHI